MVTTLWIEGMRSAHCARAVYTALTMVPGLASAEVVIGRALLEHQEPLDPASLAHAVMVAGYRLRDSQTDRRRLTLMGDSGGHAPPDSPPGTREDDAAPVARATSRTSSSP